MSGLSLQSMMTDTSNHSSSASCCGVQNVGQVERMASLIGGGVMALYGLKRGSLLMAALGAGLVYRGASGNCKLYEALGMSSNEDDAHPATAVPARAGVKYEKSYTITRPAQELYEHWRNLENLPRIMQHIQSVTQTADGQSHWKANGPFDIQVEWDAEIINDEPGRLIAWRSLPGGAVDTAGSVHFNQLSGDRGTELRVSLKYNPPGGKLGATIASWLGSGVEKEIDEDLRRFKQKMEAGEIASVEGQPTGRR